MRAVALRGDSGFSNVKVELAANVEGCGRQEAPL